MEAFELRLLRCFLGGSRQSAPVAAHDPGVGSADETLEEGIGALVAQIENGSYAEALPSKWLSILLGEFPPFDPSPPPPPPPPPPIIGRKGDSAKECYDFIKSRISAFLEVEDGDSIAAGHVEEEKQQREVLVLALGVAALSAFLQANMTGPAQQNFPVFPAHSALNGKKPLAGFDEQEWEAWARVQLMVDGCDILGKLALPQYLILAKLLLVNPAAMMATRTESESGRPKTRRWWKFRALLMQQRVLAERSASLRSALVTTSADFIQYFGTVEAIQQLGWKLHIQEAKAMVAAAHLEIGLMEHIYGHDDTARKHFDIAGESCGLELALTGVLGFRTQYQVDPKAQMVLVTSSQPSVEDDANWLDFLDDDEDQQDTTAKSEGSDVLLAPKLVDAVHEDNSVEYETLIDGDHKVLNSIEQAIILARGVDVKKNNPDDELRSWQMAPFIEAVDSQPKSHPMVKGWCQLLRVRWEKTRSRTRERCFLTMEKLVNDIREGSVKVSQRMSYVLCVPFPILPALLKEYAELMVAFGLVGDAMKLFEELELWNNLIDCYCLLGKKTAAASLIRQRLDIQPDEPRLWCSLGDVIMDDECYRKAWEVSGHHFTRAQRSLARTAYNKGNYAQAIEHWDLALSLNPLHPDGWFALGSAALKARDLDKALSAFTRQVQLDPENGESWNNIAAINMQKKRSKAAFVAFQEALKRKRNSWQIWENFSLVSLDVANFGQAVLAVEKVLDLSEEKRVELTTLTRLVEELEVRKGLRVGPTLVPGPETEDESEIEEVQNGSVDDDTYPWASLRATLPTIATSSSAGEFSLEKNGNPISVDEIVDIPGQGKDTEMLLEKVGKLLSRIVAEGSGGGEIWGLKARWHRLAGELSMRIEALLKQVRAHQGSKWQSSLDQFQIFAQSCLELCEAYMESASSAGGKRELSSAQMLLRNTMKQADHFSSSQHYKDLELCLHKVQEQMQAL